MLDIILRILPMLGILLLVLLCIIIMFLLLVLFFPVSYKISGKKDTKAFTLSARATWLFGLFRVRYAYPEPGRLTVKLLWILLYDSGKAEHEEKVTDKEKVKDKTEDRTIDKAKDKTKNKTKDKNKNRTRDKTQNKTKDKIKDKTEVISEKRTEDHSDIICHTTTGNMGNAENAKNAKNAASTNNPASADNASNTEESHSTDSVHKEHSQDASEYHEEDDGQGSDRISKKIEKIKFTICNTYDKIKKIWENITYYVFLLQEEETHLLFSHVMKRAGRILRNVRPRKLKVNVLFGTGAPDTTGYAFGVYSMFSQVLGPGVIATPDFERVVLEGDFDATGTITSVVLVWHFLKVIMDKKFWRFAGKFKTGREPAGTIKTETGEEKKTETGEENIKQDREGKLQKNF